MTTGKNLAVFLLLLLLLFSQASGAAIPEPLIDVLQENWHCVALTPQHEQAGLCLVQREFTQQWYWLHRDGRLEAIDSPPTTASALSQLMLSADGNRLVVYGADEGHPVITVVDLIALYERREATLFISGIFPGSFSPLCWLDKQILLSSDQNLAKSWHHTEQPEIANYLLEPHSGTVLATDIHDCKPLHPQRK